MRARDRYTNRPYSSMEKLSLHRLGAASTNSPPAERVLSLRTNFYSVENRRPCLAEASRSKRPVNYTKDEEIVLRSILETATSEEVAAESIMIT